jgi:hypothetical protein
MSSQPTSSSTPPEDMSFFCCGSIFDEISQYSATLLPTPGTPEGTVMADMPLRSSNLPIPKTDISTTNTDNILSKSDHIMQVRGPIDATWGLGDRPSAVEIRFIEQRVILPSTPMPRATQYFAETLAEGAPEIKKWGKLDISDERFRSEPGLNKRLPAGPYIYYKGCSKHKKSFLFNVWTR